VFRVSLEEVFQYSDGEGDPRWPHRGSPPDRW